MQPAMLVHQRVNQPKVSKSYSSGYFEVALGIDDERPGGVEFHERVDDGVANKHRGFSSILLLGLTQTCGDELF